ncbi:MAG: hypothetical protein K5622_03520 [Endomicrobiaceae bacterium]|nr:hypothetical protein [Endomicrobiaceae bacterium]
MWLLFSISSLVASLSCVIFAVLAYTNNRKSNLNFRFSIISFVIGIWALFPFITSVIPDNDKSLFYGRICYIFAIFTPPAFFHFVFATLGIDKKKFNKYLIYIFYFFSLLFLMFSFSDLLIKGVVTRAPNSYVVPGPLYIFYIFFFAALCPYSIALLFKKYGTLSGYEREQMKFLALAFFVALIAGGMHVISAYVNIEIIPHDLLIFAWSMIVFYSISKYGYLNIKLTLLKTIVFVLVYFLILGIPFYIGFKTNQWFLASIILFALSTIGPMILRYLQTKTEKILMAEQEKYQQFLLQASKGMVEQKELSKLAQLIVRMITKSVKVKFAYLFVYDEEKREFFCMVNRGEKMKDKNIIFDNKSPLISYIKSNPNPFLLFNVPKDIKKLFSSVSDNIALVINAFIRKDLIAFMLLGDKKDGSLYSKKDLEVFKTLSNQAALAVTNCKFLRETNNQQKRLFEAEKLASIGGMADGMAHQIRNRLNSFGFAAELLKYDVQDFSENHKDFIEQNPSVSEMVNNMKNMIVSIDENVKKTNTILTGILNFAKPKSSSTEKEIFSLKEIIEAARMLVQIKHHREKVPLVLDIPDEDKIYGIKYQIQEVCFNCIDNSLEAIVEKEQHLKNPLFDDIDKTMEFVPEIKVSLKYLNNKNEYQIIIKDNGIGIKQENKVKIFSAFFTTKPSSKSGSGIGSYVARRMIVESHNGDITFESKYGEGTTFFITLPLSLKKEKSV